MDSTGGYEAPDKSAYLATYFRFMIFRTDYHISLF